MRRPLETAVLRRDNQLDRTRRLSALIAGGATAASIGLAAVLGAAIPGRAAPVSNQTGVQQSGSGTSGGSGTGTGGSSGSRQGAASGSGHQGGGQAPAHRHRLSAPASPPASTTSPPVVSSGGS